MALLGVGYIGGSVVLAARAAGLVSRVVGYDPDPAALTRARVRGIIDDAAAAPDTAVRGAALVVLAAPVASIGTLAKQISLALDSDALVIDVGSVKASVVRAVEAALPAGHFVGCHPMAGTEASGAEAADGQLFRGRLCFVCPGPRASAERVAAASALWQALGARTVHVAPEPHDACMAAVSHMPHVAAFALAASLADAAPILQGHPELAAPTTSLRDTTRIAASNPVVWRDIFLENRAPLLPMVRALEDMVGNLRAALDAGDGARLEALLSMGKACRDQLTKGSG